MAWEGPLEGKVDYMVSPVLSWQWSAMHHPTKEAKKEKKKKIFQTFQDHILLINAIILVRGEINPISWTEKIQMRKRESWQRCPLAGKYCEKDTLGCITGYSIHISRAWHYWESSEKLNTLFCVFLTNIVIIFCFCKKKKKKVKENIMLFLQAVNKHLQCGHGTKCLAILNLSYPQTSFPRSNMQDEG